MLSVFASVFVSIMEFILITFGLSLGFAFAYCFATFKNGAIIASEADVVSVRGNTGFEPGNGSSNSTMDVTFSEGGQTYKVNVPMPKLLKAKAPGDSVWVLYLGSDPSNVKLLSEALLKCVIPSAAIALAVIVVSILSRVI